MTMSSHEFERKVRSTFSFLSHEQFFQNNKKQRTDEQAPAPFFTRDQILTCIDELLTSTDDETLKRKHRRTIETTVGNTKESKQSMTNENYDR